MLCENMSGKMSGCKSITSSSADNSTCQGRINKALDDIRNYSPVCNDALNRWLLPSTDKKHITQKQLVKILEKEGCKICICAFCYAYRDLSGTGIVSENKNIKFAAVGRYLSEKIREYNESAYDKRKKQDKPSAAAALTIILQPRPLQYVLEFACLDDHLGKRRQ